MDEGGARKLRNLGDFPCKLFQCRKGSGSILMLHVPILASREKGLCRAV